MSDRRRASLEPVAELVFDAAFDGDPTFYAILDEGGHYLGALLMGMELDLRVTADLHAALCQELAAAENRYGCKSKAE